MIDTSAWIPTRASLAGSDPNLPPLAPSMHGPEDDVAEVFSLSSLGLAGGLVGVAAVLGVAVASGLS